MPDEKDIKNDLNMIEKGNRHLFGEFLVNKGYINQEQFEKALLLNNEYAGAHLNLGMYFSRAHDSSTPQADAAKARKHLEKFIELAADPEGADSADISRARHTLATLATLAAPAREAE